MSTHTTIEAAAEILCQRCRLPLSESVEPLSRHRTSEGVIVYTRCACGLLGAWLHRGDADAPLIVARAAPP